MSGCRGAGKTIKIGTKLLFQQVEVQSLVKNLIKYGEEAYILVDETQANHEVALFVDLLKNMEAHNVTTIAAGISLNATTSYQFTQQYTMDALCSSRRIKIWTMKGLLDTLLQRILTTKSRHRSGFFSTISDIMSADTYFP
eukprot:scaffold45707_cov56-Attheya_sp.AAC.3